MEKNCEQNNSRRFECENGNKTFDNRNNFDNGRRPRQNDEIKNKAELEFRLCDKRHVVESNEVKAQKVKIILREEQNCRFAIENDLIEYKVRIFNDSDVDIANCEFEDRIDRNCEFERNSFRVNGKHVCPAFENDEIRYKINQLKADEELIITFDCKVK